MLSPVTRGRLVTWATSNLHRLPRLHEIRGDGILWNIRSENRRAPPGARKAEGRAGERSEHDINRLVTQACQQLR
jgi:hypothetical protein